MPGVGDWEARAWSEVTLPSYKSAAKEQTPLVPSSHSPATEKSNSRRAALAQWQQMPKASSPSKNHVRPTKVLRDAVHAVGFAHAAKWMLPGGDSFDFRALAQKVGEHGPVIGASTRCLAEVIVDKLYGGKLGVRLRDARVVSGFDVEEARSLWSEGDEIKAINGNQVKSREDFAKYYTEARHAFPIKFTVLRKEKRPVEGANEDGQVAS